MKMQSRNGILTWLKKLVLVNKKVSTTKKVEG
jgi:hypothetical protein